MLSAPRYRAVYFTTYIINQSLRHLFQLNWPLTYVRCTSAHMMHTHCSVSYCRPNIFLPSRLNCARWPGDVYPGTSLWKPHQCREGGRLVAHTWVRPRRHERGVVHRHFPWTTKPRTLKSNVRNMQIILIINSLPVLSAPFETTQETPPT
jgi:hypothetical protein